MAALADAWCGRAKAVELGLIVEATAENGDKNGNALLTPSSLLYGEDWTTAMRLSQSRDALRPTPRFRGLTGSHVMQIKPWNLGSDRAKRLSRPHSSQRKRDVSHASALRTIRMER